MILEFFVFCSIGLLVYHLSGALRCLHANGAVCRSALCPAAGVRKGGPAAESPGTDADSAPVDPDATHFSILVPCYNEAVIVPQLVASLRRTAGARHEVIFIDDGSQDDTFALLSQQLGLVADDEATLRGARGCKSWHASALPGWHVLRKENTGKGESLNCGVAFARCALLLTLDADSCLAPGALELLGQAFRDPAVLAAGGAVGIAPGASRETPRRRRVLQCWQALDYIKGFYLYKTALDTRDATAIISGAFGAFRREAVLQVGGFRASLGEDIDLTIKLQLLARATDGRVAYVPGARCITQGPATLADLTRQRMRWQKGFCDCVAHYAKRLLPHLFTDTLSFHFLFEAFGLGLFNTVFTVDALVCLLAAPTPERVSLYAFYFALHLLLRGAYLALATAAARRMGALLPHGRGLAAAIFLDITCMGWYLLGIYFSGLICYFWQPRNGLRWNKVNRYAP